MLWTWYEYRKIQPMQKIIDTRQFVAHGELFFENTDKVDAAQRTHRVAVRRPGEHTLLERFVLLRR